MSGEGEVEQVSLLLVLERRAEAGLEMCSDTAGVVCL